MSNRHPNKHQPDRSVTVPPETAALRMLGLAVRAGQAAVGRQAAIQAIRRQKACLVWLAEDAAGDTCEKIDRAALTGTVNRVVASDKQQMGQWSGRETCAVVAILDRSFSERISQLLLKRLAADEKI